MGIGGLERVEEGEVFVREKRRLFGRTRRSFVATDVVGVNRSGHGYFR